VVWLQGCSLGCPGCFNPETHSFEGGQEWTVDELCKKIEQAAGDVQGVTISGGEPMQQPQAVAALLGLVRERTNLSTLVFSGFSWEEIQTMPQALVVLPLIDVLIAGRYQEDKRVATGLIGSSNKTVHFLTSRYGPDDLVDVPEAEVIVTADGTIIVSGI